MNPALATLFAGVVLDGRDPHHDLVTLIDGSRPVVRVREVAARHHLEMVDLFDLGREADLIARCTQRLDGEKWLPVEPEWVDALTPESHLRLYELADAVNFHRVIATAERQITRSASLRALKTRLAEQQSAPMLAVMNRELGSWMSQVTQAISSALPASKSSTSP